jgi:hypothetical protein
VTYPWTTEEKQALTPGTPLVLVGTERKPDDELVLFEKLWQDGECALVRFSDSNTAPFSYAWDRLRPMSMQWASPGARPDEFALQQARIRRLEKDLGLEKEKTARERKANGELALLVHELRKDKEALEEERRVAAGFVVPTVGATLQAIHTASTDIDDGEPAAGDYVAKPQAAVEYPEPGDRVRVRSYGRAGVPWTGTVADVWACDGLMAVEADPECGLSLARHVVQLSDVVERLPRSVPITPTQQPEDALARDAGAE